MSACRWWASEPASCSVGLHSQRKQKVLDALSATDLEKTEALLIEADVARLGLTGRTALSYILKTKFGTLDAAFDWVVGNGSAFSSVQWETACALLHVDVHKLTRKDVGSMSVSSCFECCCFMFASSRPAILSAPSRHRAPNVLCRGCHCSLFRRKCKSNCQCKNMCQWRGVGGCVWDDTRKHRHCHRHGHRHPNRLAQRSTQWEVGFAIYLQILGHLEDIGPHWTQA